MMKVWDFIFAILGMVAVFGLIISIMYPATVPTSQNNNTESELPIKQKVTNITGESPINEVPKTAIKVIEPIITRPIVEPIISAETSIIKIFNLTTKEGAITIMETVWQNNTLILDAECEADIINDITGEKPVEFRSFYNDGNGIMSYFWENATKGKYTLVQYCWQGMTLDQTKIYSNSSIIIT